MKIKNVVFDIGNVLVKFAWREFFDDYGLTEDVKSRVVKATVLDPAWNLIDKGVLTREEALDRFIANDPQLNDTIRGLFKSINGMLYQFDYSKDLIKSLQARGFKVYCLSNMSQVACDDCADALNFLPILDGYILSCDVKQIKPEPEIYKIFLDKYNLKADECLFFDDLEANIEAARKAGMKGIVFKGLEDAMEQFEKMLKDTEE